VVDKLVERKVRQMIPTIIDKVTCEVERRLTRKRLDNKYLGKYRFAQV
jgi:hypothetical protein